MKQINLTFQGWYDNRNVDKIPETQGIYLAYAIKWFDEEKSMFEILRLVYIGKAEGTNNLRKRIREHIESTDTERNDIIWIKKLKDKMIDADAILYSYADLSLADIETALIYANERNGLLNIIDTNGHNNENAKALQVICDGDCDELKNHDVES